MGANAVNTACERLRAAGETITGGRVHLRILSNLADRRLTRSTCLIPPGELAFSKYSGEAVRDRNNRGLGVRGRGSLPCRDATTRGS